MAREVGMSNKAMGPYKWFVKAKLSFHNELDIKVYKVSPDECTIDGYHLYDEKDEHAGFVNLSNELDEHFFYHEDSAIKCAREIAHKIHSKSYDLYSKSNKDLYAHKNKSKLNEYWLSFVE
jgi:hypothetical protein